MKRGFKRRGFVIVIVSILMILFICSSGIAQEKAYKWDKNTILLLHFDEGEGDVFYDSEEENMGEIFDATWVKGKFGQALKFDGKNSYAKITCPFLLDEGITLEAWVYHDHYQDGQRQIISTNGCQLLLMCDMPRMNLIIDGEYRTITSDAPLKFKKWYHIAGTYNISTGTMKLFVDGKEVKSLTLSNLNSYDLPTGEATTFTIGAYNAELEHFAGIIDEVRISDTIRKFSPLSAGEEKEILKSTIPEEELMSKARWIWYPENASQDAVGQTRFFRKNIKIDSSIETASFWITADDHYLLRVNGYLCNERTEEIKDEWKNIDYYDLKNYLKKGENIIAVRVKNDASVAGLICRGEITLSSGNNIGIYSDASWKAAKTSSEDWFSINLDDSSWVNAKVIGDAFASPWSLSINPDVFLDFEERELIKKREEESIMKFAQIEKELEKEEKPVVKIDFFKGSPMILVNGKPLPTLFYRTYDNPFTSSNSAKEFKNFKEAGINLYNVEIRIDAVWKSYDEYDFTILDNMIRKIISINPESYLFLGICLDAPSWWIGTHKDELVGYATGPATSGVDQAQRYIAASFASEVWKKETGGAVRKLIRHIEEMAYGKRIIAYQMGYGVYTEWHYYGMASDMPDTGKAMTLRFRNWLKEKYNNDVNSLQKSWKDKNVNFDNATVPNEEERWKMGCLVLRDPTIDKKVIDYYYCHQEVVAECLLYFDNIAKEETGGRLLTGNFYGYFFGMGYPPEGQNCGEIERVLKSPAVDYLTAPYCYDKRARDIGGSGQFRTIAETYRLHKKLHIEEADDRTHLTSENSNKYAFDPTDSIALISREFCNAFIHGTGVWFLDFSGQWFDDKDIIQTMKKMQEISSNNIKTDKSSVSEVAVVCDPENISYVGYPAPPLNLAYTLISGTVFELCYTGVPFDTILLTDLENKELNNYKVYIFLNPFYLTSQKREMINNLKKDGKTLVFLYAPNFITEEGISEKALSEMVGMKVKYEPKKIQQEIEITNARNLVTSQLKEGVFPPQDSIDKVNDGPFFYIRDSSVTTLGNIKYESEELPGLAIKKFDNWTSIYCSIPFLPRSIFRGIFKNAGVHQYIDTEDVIYANHSFLAIHTKEGGKKKITLPQPHNIKELFTGKEIGKNLSTFEIEIPPVSTFLFQFE